MKNLKFIVFSILFITLGVSIFASTVIFKGGNKKNTIVSPTPSPYAASSAVLDGPKITTTPKETTFEVPLATCIASEKQKISAVQYEKGSILVSFQSSVTFKDAEGIIASNGLEYQGRENIETDFKTNHWLGVTTPKGEEFKWICELKTNSKVKTVILNRLFDLHE